VCVSYFPLQNAYSERLHSSRGDGEGRTRGLLFVFLRCSDVMAKLCLLQCSAVIQSELRVFKILRESLGDCDIVLPTVAICSVLYGIGKSCTMCRSEDLLCDTYPSGNGKSSKITLYFFPLCYICLYTYLSIR
jgi:hypothetical protein